MLGKAMSLMSRSICGSAAYSRGMESFNKQPLQQTGLVAARAAHPPVEVRTVLWQGHVSQYSGDSAARSRGLQFAP